MPRFVSTLRAVYDAEDEVEAVFIAHQIRQNGMMDLDEEDGDILDVTQTTSNAVALEPAELLMQLRKTRNALIKTRIKECFAQAQELDKLIHILGNREEEPGYAISGYSHGDFIDLAMQILREGVEPDVG